MKTWLKLLPDEPIWLKLPDYDETPSEVYPTLKAFIKKFEEVFEEVTHWARVCYLGVLASGTHFALVFKRKPKVATRPIRRAARCRPSGELLSPAYEEQ